MVETKFMQQFGFNKRRSRLEIYIDILRIIENGINKPTRIMFAANLSWKTLNEILTDLEERGLIEQRTIGGRRLFFITEGGKRVLKAFEILSTEFTGQDLIYMQRPRDLMKTKHTLQINT